MLSRFLPRSGPAGRPRSDDRFLDFSEADLTLRPDGTFTAVLLAPSPLPTLDGHWHVHDVYLATAITALR
ncbi:hypothetical protein ACFWOG_01315 [Kitasatospora sp. NPDC058406]|uniref:hypothetical protein n=1 Tax=Kitasatospora sp. NPDC058406 TaxID=3346483 RepID=UPI0036496B98